VADAPLSSRATSTSTRSSARSPWPAGGGTKMPVDGRWATPVLVGDGDLDLGQGVVSDGVGEAEAAGVGAEAGAGRAMVGSWVGGWAEPQVRGGEPPVGRRGDDVTHRGAVGRGSSENATSTRCQGRTSSATVAACSSSAGTVTSSQPVTVGGASRVVGEVELRVLREVHDLDRGPAELADRVDARRAAAGPRRRPAPPGDDQVQQARGGQLRQQVAGLVASAAAA
jgi:hypothetical protein